MENKLTDAEIEVMARTALKHFKAEELKSLFSMGAAFIEIYKLAVKDTYEFLGIKKMHSKEISKIKNCSYLPDPGGEVVRELIEELDKTRAVLNILYDETADYIKINNLGDVHHNRSMQLARDILN